MVEAGAMPELVRLTSEAEWQVREQAAWALGNVAGESVLCRDVVLRAGGLEALVAMVSAGASAAVSQSYMVNAAWALSNLVRGKPPPPLDVVKRALVLVVVLAKHSNAEVVARALWAAVLATDPGGAYVQAALECGVFEAVKPHLNNERAPQWQVPSVRVVGNALSCEHEHTQALIDRGVLPELRRALASQNHMVVKEVLWSLSNIAAGTQAQVAALLAADVVDLAGDKLIYGLPELRRDAAWLVANLATNCTDEQVRCLVEEHRLLLLMAHAMRVRDSSLLRTLLMAFKRVLDIGASMPGDNMYALRAEELGCVEILEQKLERADDLLYNIISDILDTHFASDAGDFAEVVEPGCPVMFAGQQGLPGLSLSPAAIAAFGQQQQQGGPAPTASTMFFN